MPWWTQTATRPIECSRGNAIIVPSLGVNVLMFFSDSHKNGENKTTHRSLIGPILTSSFNWEETDPGTLPTECSERSSNVMIMFSFAVNMCFAAVGAVVLIYLFCRETPLRSVCSSTLMGSAAELIGLAVLIESWHPRCEETVCLFGTARLTHMRCDACWCLSQEQSIGNASNVHVFCCYVAKLGNGHDDLRAAVVIRCQLRGFV